MQDELVWCVLYSFISIGPFSSWPVSEQAVEMAAYQKIQRESTNCVGIKSLFSVFLRRLLSSKKDRKENTQWT